MERRQENHHRDESLRQLHLLQLHFPVTRPGLPRKFWSDTVGTVTAKSDRHTLRELQETGGNNMPAVAVPPETSRRLLAKPSYQACFVMRHSKKTQATISSSAGDRHEEHSALPSVTATPNVNDVRYL